MQLPVFTFQPVHGAHDTQAVSVEPDSLMKGN